MDDICILWSGSQEEFLEFFSLMDQHHRNIHFTCEPDFAKQTTTFLDVNVTIGNGVMTTDLYVKPTSVNQYLSPASSHPPCVTRNIPYSLAFRLRRICSEDQDVESQLQKLIDMSIECGYRLRVIESAFDRVRRLSREYIYIII